MKKNYGFKEVNEEISTELTLMRAAQMEEWLTALEMEQDLSVADMIDSVPVSLLTDEDEKDIFLFENDDNAILAQAAQSLRMLSEYDPTNLPPVEEYQKSPSLRSYEPAGEDCAEWLQMRQRSVASHVKTYARYLKGSGYELDDLIQEANLAIFSGWNAYDPATGSRDSFCWYIVYNKMRGLCRKALSQKRNFSTTESIDAVILAHSGFEQSCGSVTWSSTTRQDQSESDLALRYELSAAVAALAEEKREILSLLAEGYTQTEIAEILGRCQAGVSYHVTEGRRELKAAIA